MFDDRWSMTGGRKSVVDQRFNPSAGSGQAFQRFNEFGSINKKGMAFSYCSVS